MKKIFIICMVCSAALAGCRHEANELKHDHAHEVAEAAGAHTVHDGEILLDNHRAGELGVVVSELKPGDFATVVEVSGELTGAPADEATVPARSAGVVKLAHGITDGVHVTSGQSIATVSARGMAAGYADRSARVAYDAAKRELDRLTPLAADGIVTRRDYNAAKARFEEAKAALDGTGQGASSAATAPRSGTLTQLLVTDGQYVEAGAPIAIIAGNSSLSLRADVPQRHAAFVKTVSGASFRPTYASEATDIATYGGRLTGRPTGAGASGGYIPVFFTLNNDGTLVAGTYCTVYLRGALRHDVLTVPVEAVTEQQGEKFVYLAVHDGAYRKQPVTLGESDGQRVELTAGVKPGDRVVTSGATFVRLAETADVVPEGHKH